MKKAFVIYLPFASAIFCAFFLVQITNAENNHNSEANLVTSYITSADRTFQFQKVHILLSEKPSDEMATIMLKPSIKYQEIEGFGAAITGSTCYNLMQMELEDRRKFLEETFSHRRGMGYSYVRISIGCSDFSLSEYTLCDTPGIENFSLQDEEIKYIIPILKEILAINPSLKIKGAPWTPPRWMKVNNLTDLQPYNSWTGGHLNPACYKDYATYFLKWIQAFAEHGIEITSVSPQNEPLHTGNSASLFMGWEEQREFIKVLGPRLRNAGFNTKIYVFDHNYNYDNIQDQFNYPVKIYDDEVARQFVAGAAYHNYGGNRNELINIHNQAPDKELIFTETSIGTWNNGRDFQTRLLEDMKEVALGTVNNWCRGVIVWNLMLDMDRGPNRDLGCRTCFGAVDIDATDYKTIVRNSHYYIIGHMSSVVKPGAVRIGTEGFEEEGIAWAAFENKDDTYALVLKNSTGNEKLIQIKDGFNQFAYKVPAKSVMSFLWESIPDFWLDIDSFD